MLFQKSQQDVLLNSIVCKIQVSHLGILNRFLLHRPLNKYTAIEIEIPGTDIIVLTYHFAI